MQRYRSGASFSKFSFITAIRGAFIITSRARFDVIIFYLDGRVTASQILISEISSCCSLLTKYFYLCYRSPLYWAVFCQNKQKKTDLFCVVTVVLT
jgi:hypothetical protein